MFDGISDAFSNALGKLTGSGELTEANIEEALREIQRAFLEADVSYQVTKEFLVGVREKLVGLSKTPGLQPLQQVAVVVHEELTKLMGPVDTRISENPLGPTLEIRQEVVCTCALYTSFCCCPQGRLVP